MREARKGWRKKSDRMSGADMGDSMSGDVLEEITGHNKRRRFKKSKGRGMKGFFSGLRKFSRLF